MVGDKAAYSYQLSDAADDDVAGILRFTVVRWSVKQADIYLDGFEETFERIARSPFGARERTQFKPPIRIAHYKSHVVIYRIEEEVVQIIPILHGRSNWSAILSGDP